MTDSPVEIVFIVVAWVTLIGLSLLVVRLDERRLALRGREEALEHAWSPTSRDAAIVGLGFLLSPLVSLFAVFFHFVRTRARSRPRARWVPGALVGVGLGAAAVTAIFAAYALVVTAIAWAFGVDV